MGRTRRSPTRSARTTRRRSLTSVTRPSSGWMPTSSPRWRSSRTSRRRWRECATPSSPSSTSRLEELQEACLTWEECQVVCQELVQEVLLQEVQDLDQPSRRLTKFNPTTTEALLNSVNNSSLCKLVKKLHFCSAFNIRK